mmetsp:Transcript_6598/g.20603  ORF Transcript_6598/g.20603 Transcript_6598/m.20603 type:complete len:321 (+) Transcript_6598:23-985(+)
MLLALLAVAPTITALKTPCTDRRWALRTAASAWWLCNNNQCVRAEDVVFPKQSTRGQRAVGAPNPEGVDIDAALGISWGGRDRCDAADPECGAQGRLGGSDAPLLEPPGLTRKPRRVARLRISIANEDAGVLLVGLRDDVEAADVFGALASREFAADDADPAGLVDGGVEWCIRPARVTLAATAQAQELAFRRRYGLRKTPENFQAATMAKALVAKPSSAFTREDDDPTQPGLLVVANSGPGPRLEFAFVGPAAARADRRRDDSVVVGALLDEDSVRLLTRLANLPVVADRAALGGKACRPIVKLAVSRADLVLDEPQQR